MTQRGSILAAATGGLLAWVGAALIVRTNDGFGAGDLAGFAVWCGVFALVLATLAATVLPQLARGSRFRRLLVGAATGAGAGALFTLALAFGMGPWILAFSFPVAWLWTGAGALGLALANLAAPIATEPIRLRRVLVVAGLLLLAVVVLPALIGLGNMYLWGRATSERYILSTGYRGAVFVIYQQPGSPPLPREGRARLLEIPSSGVLLTSEPLTEGWKDPEVFMLDSMGARQPVQRDWAHRDTTWGVVHAHWLSTRMPATLNGELQPSMRYEALVIGSHPDDSILVHRSDAQLDTLWQRYAR